MQTVLCTISIGITKKFGAGLLLVTANSEAGYAAALKADRELSHTLCFRGPKLAYRIEDPEHRGAEIPLAPLAAALQPFNNCTEILLTPQADANGNVNLGVQDILCCELFHEAISNQFIIFRRLQIFGDRLEGHQEATKILILVKQFDFWKCAGLAMALPQLKPGCGINRAFEMEMQIGLW